MSSHDEQQIALMLQERARIWDRPILDPDTAIVAGRRLVRQRRLAAGGVSAVVLAGVAFGALCISQPDRDLVGSGAPMPTFALRTAAASGTITTAKAGIDVLAGNQMYTAAGQVVPIRMGASVRADAAARVPTGGWLVNYTDGASTKRLGYARGNGGWTDLGGFDNARLSPDGRTLVALPAGQNQAVAYAFPDMRRQNSTSLAGIIRPGEDSRGVEVIGFANNRVLLSGAPGSEIGAKTLVWDISSGKSETSTGLMWAREVTAVGDVVRAVTAGTSTSPRTCLDLVPLAERVSTKASGLCGDSTFLLGGGTFAASPAGNWLLAAVPVRSSKDSTAGAVWTWVTLRRADVTAGRWSATTLGRTGGLPYFFDSEETFVVDSAVQGGGTSMYLRCTVKGVCLTLQLPTGVGAGAVLVDPGSGG